MSFFCLTLSYADFQHIQHSSAGITIDQLLTEFLKHFPIYLMPCFLVLIPREKVKCSSLPTVFIRGITLYLSIFHLHFSPARVSVYTAILHTLLHILQLSPSTQLWTLFQLYYIPFRVRYHNYKRQAYHGFIQHNNILLFHHAFCSFTFKIQLLLRH